MSLIHKRFDKKIKECYNPIRNLYEIHTHDDGYDFLVKNGEKNQYDEIQSFADACDFDRILERVALGDTSMLRDISNSNFVDTTDIPTTPFEVIKLSRENAALFDSLPSEVKAAFNNNYIEFANAVIDKSFKQVVDNIKSANHVDGGASPEPKGDDTK